MSDSNVMESGIFYAKKALISPVRTDVFSSFDWYLISNDIRYDYQNILRNI